VSNLDYLIFGNPMKYIFWVCGGYLLFMTIVLFKIKSKKKEEFLSGVFAILVGTWLFEGSIEAWHGGGGYERWITSWGRGDFVAKYIFPFGIFIAFFGSFCILEPFSFFEEHKNKLLRIIGSIGLIIYILTIILFFFGGWIKELII